MGPLGVPEMIIIFIVALVLFGPRKLPELGKTVGKALTEFRRARDELKGTWDREMATIERETASVRSEVQKHVDELHSATSDYQYDHHGYGNDAYHDSYHDYSYSGDSNAVSSSTTDSAAQLADSSVSASETQGADNASSTIASNGASAPEGTVPNGSGISNSSSEEAAPAKPTRGPAIVA